MRDDVGKVYSGTPTPPELKEIEEQILAIEIPPSTGSAQRILDQYGHKFALEAIRSAIRDECYCSPRRHK